MTATTSHSKTEKTEALARLREWMPAGSTVYTILRHVAPSGMSRTIGLVVFVDGQPRHPNHAAATVLGLRTDPKRDGINIRGGGMDMGFQIVYNLSRILYGRDGAIRHEWL